MLPPLDIERIKAAAELAKPLPFNNVYKGSLLKELVDQCISDHPPTGEEVRERLKSIDEAPFNMQKPVYKNGNLIALLQLLVPGVDETQHNGVTYRGFKRFNHGSNHDQNRFLELAMDSMTKLKLLATWCNKWVSEFAQLGKDEPTNEQQSWTKQHYQLWFDEKIKRHRLEKVKSVYANLNQEINAKSFTVFCDGADGRDPIIFSQKLNAASTHAFVVKSEQLNRIYLCERFWHDEEQNSGKRICTLLHELTHLEHIGNTEDNPKLSDAVDQMQINAKNFPEIACNNAENYARFAEGLLQKGVIVF